MLCFFFLKIIWLWLCILFPFLLYPFACLFLQILSSVLDMVPFSFSIKLAALASRKELIDLEKWLSSSLNIYKDNFFEVIFSWPGYHCHLLIRIPSLGAVHRIKLCQSQIMFTTDTMSLMSIIQLSGVPKIYKGDSHWGIT